MLIAVSRYDDMQFVLWYQANVSSQSASEKNKTVTFVAMFLGRPGEQ